MSVPSTPPRSEIEALQRRIGELESATAEQKRVEEALRESEGKLRALLEAASEGIIVVDQRGRIVLVNARLEAMFGYDRTELLGQPLEGLVPERVRAAHVEHRAGYSANPHVRPMGRGFDLAGGGRTARNSPSRSA